MNKNRYSVDQILKSSVRHLMLFGAIAIVIAFLTQFYVLSYQSHQAACEIVSARLNQFIGPLSRELAVGEFNIANSIFTDFKKVLEIPGARPNLEMTIKAEEEASTYSCKASVFGAEVYAPISFAGKNVAAIKGRVAYSPTLALILFATIVIFGLLLGVRVWTKRLITQIQHLLVRPIKNLSQGGSIEGNENLPFEVLDVGQNIEELKEKLLKEEKISAEIAHEKQMNEIALQVAHDIRSPLSVLALLDREDFIFNEQTRPLIASARKRVHDIAQTFIGKYRKEDLESNSISNNATLASTVIESIVREKISRVAGSEIKIIKVIDSDTKSKFINVNNIEFGRVLSNLLDNSIEALLTHLDSQKEIKISTKCIHGFLEIIISDSGPGIAASLIPSLSQKGVTTKASGNGLGLFYSRFVCENAKGTFKIDSQEGFGTNVILKIPIVESKISFALIDDDDLVQAAWKLEAKHQGINIVVFPNVDNFLEANLPKETIIFIDESLGKGISGRTEAVRLFLKGYKTIHLETGWDNLKFIPDEIKSVQSKHFPSKELYS